MVHDGSVVEQKSCKRDSRLEWSFLGMSEGVLRSKGRDDDGVGRSKDAPEDIEARKGSQKQSLGV